MADDDVERISDDIARTREHLTGTLTALEHKAEVPTRLRTEAVPWAVNLLRRRAIALAAPFVALALVLAARRRRRA